MIILSERVARPDQIDAVMRDCCGFRMGPFELADLTGMDVNYRANVAIREGYGQDPRLKTGTAHHIAFESGHYGRKTGKGFYQYDGTGRRSSVDEIDLAPARPPCDAAIVARDDPRLAEFALGINVAPLFEDDGLHPILAAPLGEDCSRFAARTETDPRRLVAVDLACDVSRRVTIMTAPGADTDFRDQIAAAIIAAGRRVTAISDSCGFISQRIQAMIGNLGCEAAQMQVASPRDIDKAVKLALNYPSGPLEWVSQFGEAKVLRILQHLQEQSGDDRYRPSPWLRRRAELGLPIHTV
jgi:3-hydroxybutyryl-CoA dehydrogenase